MFYFCTALATLSCVFMANGQDQLLKINVTFYPAEIRDVVENTIRNITVHYIWDKSTYRAVKLTVKAKDTDYVEVHGNSTFILDYSGAGTNDTVIQVMGVFLSKTAITCTFEPMEPMTGVEPLSIDYKVGVIRQPSVLDTIFMVSVIAMVAINTIGFGCRMDLDVVKEILKKPIAPIIGFLCQYTIMPLTAYALGKIVDLSPELAFGLFVVGACPGGGGSNMWSVLLDGDLNLSLTMTFFSVVASLGMLPLWLYTLGSTILEDNIHIPFKNIAISLVSLVVPCVIGVLIRRFRPKIADVLSKVVKPAAFVIVLFMATFGVYANLYIFLMLGDWKITVSGLLLPYTGLVISGLVAFACRRPWYRIKTIMFETAIQNASLAIALVKLSLAQPEADLGAVMPVTASVFTPFPLLICFISLMIYRRCCKTKSEKSEISTTEIGLKRQDSEFQLTKDDENAIVAKELEANSETRAIDNVVNTVSST